MELEVGVSVRVGDGDLSGVGGGGLSKAQRSGSEWGWR